MAYNVLKGSIEGSVDQHGDQEINGIKMLEKHTINFLRNNVKYFDVKNGCFGNK